MSLLGGLEQCGQFAWFALRALPAGLMAWRAPGELLRQLHSILLGALPLGLVAGLALGIVVWMHSRGLIDPQLRDKVPEYLAWAIVVEFAPLGAGLIVAGRSGAQIGAELGSMRLTEQIDALECLGLSPMRVLVAPRVLACILALPLLTIFIDYLAVFSGFVAEAITGG